MGTCQSTCQRLEDDPVVKHNHKLVSTAKKLPYVKTNFSDDKESPNANDLLSPGFTEAETPAPFWTPATENNNKNAPLSLQSIISGASSVGH